MRRSFERFRKTSASIAALLLAAAPGACGNRSSGDAHGEHGEERAGEHAEHGREGAGGGRGEHEDEAEEVVRLTREQLATLQLTTEEVRMRAVASEIVATAELEPPDDGVARVGSKLSGRIMKLPVMVGARVRPGQLIAVVDSPELGTAKADYLMALAQAKLTRETADREKVLFEKKITAERDYRVAEAEATKARAAKEAAEARLHTFGISDAQLGQLGAEQHASSSILVTTPIAGVLVERPVALGQVIEPADTVGVVMNLGTVWMQVDAYERDLAQLAIGQQVRATVAAWPERVFQGEIQAIGAVVDRRSRTVKVRVVMPNADGALKPGMFARVTLAGSKGEARQGLFAPRAAVLRDGDRAIVFVPLGGGGEGQRGDGGGAFQLREVELGVASDGWVQITRGLAEGEKVVTRGAFQLKSEARRSSFGGHEH